MTISDRRADNIAIIVILTIICATIVTIVALSLHYLNIGAAREHKLAAQCVMVGGTWHHGTSSTCTWGLEHSKEDQ